MSSRIVGVGWCVLASLAFRKKTFECKKSAYSNFLPILDTLGDAGVSDALMSGAAELCLEGLEKRPLMLSLFSVNAIASSSQKIDKSLRFFSLYFVLCKLKRE